MAEIKRTTDRNRAIQAMMTDGEQLKSFYRFVANNPHIALLIGATAIKNRCFVFSQRADCFVRTNPPIITSIRQSRHCAKYPLNRPIRRLFRKTTAATERDKEYRKRLRRVAVAKRKTISISRTNILRRICAFRGCDGIQ